MASLIGKVQIGTRLIVTIETVEHKSTLRYIGPIDGKQGQWLGVELDEPKGKHSGDIDGKVYFRANPKCGAFLKAKNATLEDGTSLETILKQEVPPLKKEPSKPTATATTAEKKPVAPPTSRATVTSGATTARGTVGKTTPATTATGAKKPATSLSTAAEQKNKLASELQSAMNAEVDSLKEEVAKLEEELKVIKQTPTQQEITSLKERVAKLEEENRHLSLERDRTVNQVDTSRETKLKELTQEMEFYKNQKDLAEKEKKRMENRLADLEAALEEEAGKEELIEKMSSKIETLETKNEVLRGELENAKTELKNKGGSSSSNASNTAIATQLSSETLKAEIADLNETVILLDSELTAEKEKREELEKQIQANDAKLAEFNKMEKKLKMKEKEVTDIKETLDEYSEAVAFAEKLSWQKMKLEEELQTAKTKITELLNDKEQLEQIQQTHEEFAKEFEKEINERDTIIERLQAKIKDKDRELDQQAKQLAKYRDKLAQVLRAQEGSNRKQQVPVENLDESQTQSMIQNTQQSHQQVTEILKYAETINEKYLKLQNDFSLVKNKVGTYMMNMMEALPQDFREKFYPEGIDLLVSIKTAKDKLYFLFEHTSAQLRDKNDLYTEENADLANWMLMLLARVEACFHNLHRIEVLLTVCNNEEELANIVTRRVIREKVNFVDMIISEIINKFTTNSISTSLEFDKLDEAAKALEENNNAITHSLEKEHEIKITLASETMKNITYCLQMVLNFRLLSELKENAQLDLSFDNHIRKSLEYLRELCLHVGVRYRPSMLNYLEGLKLINEEFKVIESQNLILHLENLNEQKEEITVLKETLLTVQNYLKELLTDLADLQFSDELRKIQTRLPGALWKNRIEFIHSELLKVKQLTDQRDLLELELVEAKKKILLQEKDIKDKIVVKDHLEKRIGELQLQVEKVTLLENEIKRLNERLRNSEECTKAMEDELENLMKKKAQLEEDLKKTKEKVQSGPASRAPSSNNRIAVSNILSINSVPVKQLLKENSALRNAQLKEKVSGLKHSHVIGLSKLSAPADPYKALRRKALESLVSTKIVGLDFNTVEKPDELTSDKMFIEMEKITKEAQQAEKFKLVEVGTVRVNNSLELCSRVASLGYAHLRKCIPSVIRSA